METINNIASGAAKLVWGENNITTTSTSNETTNDNAVNNNKMNAATQHQEPVSGKLGDTSKGEPFDAGNIEPAQTQTPGLETYKDPLAEIKNPGLETSKDSLAETKTSGELPTHNRSSTTEITGTKGPTSDYSSTTGNQGGFKAAQADIRDPESSATTDPKVEAELKNVDDTGALDEGNNPAKADGPGPKPIEEVARERGGDAANIGDKKGEAKNDNPEGLSGNSESKGTGEQYVKSSGLKADGGDFDATKPGAGREADRILEEKGITNPAAAAAASKSAPEDTSSSASPDSKKDKTSLKDKIKAKLHKN